MKLFASLFLIALASCIVEPAQPVAVAPVGPAPVEAGPPGPRWEQCANEHQVCNVPGPAEVRYGANGRFAFRNVNGPVPCENSVFGDPAYGVVKACFVRVR